MNKYRITPDIFADKMNILVYGDAGAGKTHLAGTAQDHTNMKDVLLYNIDGGTLTLAERGDIDAIDIRYPDQLEQELWKLMNKSTNPDYANYKTVVLDNITELQLLGLEGIVAKEQIERVKRDKNYTIDDVWQEDYGKSTKQLQRLLRGFRDLPMHVIYVAHRKDKIRKGTTIIEESKPSLTDKLLTSVMGYMDFVWYLYTADVPVSNGQQTWNVTERFLLTQPMNNFKVKTRGSTFANTIGSVVQNPNLATLMDTFLRVGMHDRQ